LFGEKNGKQLRRLVDRHVAGCPGTDYNTVSMSRSCSRCMTGAISQDDFY